MNDEKNIDISDAVKLFMCTDRLHRAAIESRVKQFGIHRSQHIALMYLARRETPPTQADIARHLEISPAAVTTTLKKLEAANLVKRTVQDGNCRANDIEITEKGRNIVAESRKMFKEVDNAMFEGVTDDELATLASIFKRLHKNLKNMLPDGEAHFTQTKQERDG